MLNLIEIEEKCNRLKFSKKVEPVVCGNSNYYMKFTFDEDWENCENKLAMIEVLDKTILIKLENDEIQLPPMPNAPSFYLSLTAELEDGGSLMTNILRVPLENNQLGEEIVMKGPFENYYASLSKTLAEIENGNIVAKHSETSNTANFCETANSCESAKTCETASFASRAEYSDYAKGSDKSETSSFATRALTADSATTATTCETANHATTADLATTATSAESSKTSESANTCKTADFASRAEYSEYAKGSDKSETATYATTAGKSKTQVSKTGDETIEGVKNFNDDVRKKNKSLLSADEVSNPNLLLNDEMKINQRFSTYYYGPNTYGPDRWFLVDDCAFMEQDSDELWFAGIEDAEEVGSRIVLKQNLEYFTSLKGKAVTCTFCYGEIEEDVENSLKLVVYDGVQVTESDIVSGQGKTIVKAVISSDATTVEVRIETKTNGINAKMKFLNCKLEVGETPTAFSPKSYSQDLFECQRYFQKATTNGLTNVPATVNSLIVSIPLINSLRISPTLLVSSTPRIYGNGSAIVVTGYKIEDIVSNAIMVNFKTTQSLTLNEIYAISDTTIEFDAEMY